MKHTVYIAPGYNSCNIYVMPYGMRPNQSPEQLADRYKDQWVRIGQLNHELKLRYLDADFDYLKDDLEGQMGGTFFEFKPEHPVVKLSTKAPMARAS